MHNDNPGVLIEYRGHTLTADEFHALVYGVLGLFIGASEEVYRVVLKEPHYFLGGLVLSFLIGRRFRR
jgi:hypothetical protein